MPLGRVLGGTPALAGAEQFRTKVEQHLTIATFPIGNQRQVPGGVDHLDRCPYGPLEKLTVLTSTPQFPDKARSSLQQDDGPPLSVLGGKVFFTLVYSSSPSITNLINPFQNLGEDIRAVLVVEQHWPSLALPPRL